MIEFGEKIKRLREEKGMTQQSMADRLYVTRQAVSRWECGARYPDLLMAKRIADALGTSVDELVSGEELKRDVEKEPVLMTPVSNCIQAMLFAMGATTYLIMGIAFLHSVRGPVESFRTAAYICFLALGYAISLIAMAAGIYFSVKNTLSPRKTGMIMSAEFLRIWFSFFGYCFITVFAGNGRVARVTVLLLTGNIVAVLLVNRFFFSRKRVSPVFVYIVGIMLLLQEIWHFSQMLMVDFIAADTAVVTFLVNALGQCAIAMLLIYQAYVLDRKRRLARCEKGQENGTTKEGK